MKKLLFILLIFTSLFSFCKKEDKPDPTEPVLPIDNSHIFFGNYDNMIMTTLDTVVEGGYYSPAYLKLDIDSNNIDDVMFTCEQTGSQMYGTDFHSEFEIMQGGLQFCGFHTIDTVFLSIDSVFHLNKLSLG